MGKLKLIVATLVVAGLALVLAAQYSSNEKLRRENEALKLVIAELKQSQDGRAPVSSDDGVSKEQLDELLKLRGEVTQLRGQTNQIAALMDANQKLRASLADSKIVQTNVTLRPMKKNPEDALPQDIHPKETWGYRGYSTPDATIESMSWAMFKGDKAAFMAGLSPEVLAKMSTDIENDFDKELTSRDVGEFRILDRQTLADDETAITIYSTRKNANGDYVGNSENLVFKKIDGQWKVADSAVTPK